MFTDDRKELFSGAKTKKRWKFRERACWRRVTGSPAWSRFPTVGSSIPLMVQSLVYVLMEYNQPGGTAHTGNRRQRLAYHTKRASGSRAATPSVVGLPLCGRHETDWKPLRLVAGVVACGASRFPLCQGPKKRSVSTMAAVLPVLVFAPQLVSQSSKGEFALVRQ